VSKRVGRALALAVLGGTVAAVGLVHAQDDSPEEDEPIEPALGFDLGDFEFAAPSGLEAEPDELAAWRELEARANIRARELADRVLTRDPRSYVAHYVLGRVYHYGEANFPRALFHLRRALELYRERHGDPPRPGSPWRWHAQILQELIWTHADLDHYEEQLAWIARYNELYDPDLVAEAAWPLMKLRRFDEARRAAELGRRTGDPRQEEIALNALCAIEFEAGNDRASYEACRAAMELRGANPALQSAVDFTNFAEAARSVFDLEEAERVDLEATRALVSWYGNPWVELGELYIREGRFLEALQALREVPRYRAQRPPHVQESDRNEARRVLAEFFLVLGRTEDAVRITERAILAPDRRGHNSRDPAQDLALAALLDRRARSMEAERLIIESLGAPVHERFWARLRALMYRFEAWSSGRRAARALADDPRLIGTFMIGTARSAVLPPWLAGELVEILGPGVAIAAIRKARAEDHRPGSDAYYDAFEAEAALQSGTWERARELALKALEGLQPAELLLRARMHAIAAEAARRTGQIHRALESYDEAFQIDPGIFPRMALAVPVRIRTRGGAIAEKVGALLGRSPRFDVEDFGPRVEVEAEALRARVCLIGASGSVLGCAEVERGSSEPEDRYVNRISTEFHRAAFAPRVELSQVDANSLDGSNTVVRHSLDSLFGSSRAEELDR
jgi:tetratricopeptide (TPR) repeat protein